MKKIGAFLRGKGFEFLFMIFSVLSVGYVTNRMSRMLYAFFSKDLSVWILLFLVLLLGYMFLYIKCKKEMKKTRNLYEGCSVILCFLLYLVMCLWVYDLITLFVSINQDRFYILPVIASILITFYGFVHAKKLYIQKYSMPISAFKKTIVLSDIHVGTFVDLNQLERIVQKVNSLHPKRIVIAGDLFDVEAFAYCDTQAIAKILSKLEAKEVYASLGNHDPDSNTQAIKDFYQETGIRLLIDEGIETEDALILGRDDITTNPNRLPLSSLISTRTKPILVIDHNPLGIQEAVSEGVACVVCGHTHRGQFFPANLFTKLAYGTNEFYGYHTIGNTLAVISSGAGFFQMPMRIGSNSEIVVLE